MGKINLILLSFTIISILGVLHLCNRQINENLKYTVNIATDSYFVGCVEMGKVLLPPETHVEIIDACKKAAVEYSKPIEKLVNESN